MNFGICTIHFLIIKTKSKKELKRGIFQYAQSYINGDILSILLTLSKFVYGFDQGRSLAKALLLMRQTKDELRISIQDQKYLGFQLFKLWQDKYDYFSKVLENNFILNKLDDNQVLVIINLTNEFKKAERDFINEDSYELIGEKKDEYKVVKGTDINIENVQHPNRYLLLRTIKEDKQVVEDFGDFSYINIDKLLKVYALKPGVAERIALDISEICSQINRWLKTTDGELYLG